MKLALGFHEYYQEEFLDPWLRRESFSSPEGGTGGTTLIL
jgi:hypothetical protein